MYRHLMVILLIPVLTAGCTALRSDIGTHVTYCCTETGLRSVEVVVSDVPAFLGPLMVSNLHVALAHKCLQPVDQNAELIATISYEQHNLGTSRERDDFEERISPGESQRFSARMVIAIRVSMTDELIWSGYVERMHDVAPN